MPQLISPSQAARAAEAFAAATTVAAPAKGPVEALGELSLREQAAYSEAHPGVGSRIYIELGPDNFQFNWKKVRCMVTPLIVPSLCLLGT